MTTNEPRPGQDGPGYSASGQRPLPQHSEPENEGPWSKRCWVQFRKATVGGLLIAGVGGGDGWPGLPEAGLPAWGGGQDPSARSRRTVATAVLLHGTA